MADEPVTPDNMRLWSVLGRTNPNETKGFKRSGGFSGTAIKPMWVWQRLTEKFGPKGTGWGCEKPEFTITPGAGQEVLVYCTVEGWYTEGSGTCRVFGVGGDKVIATYSKGPTSDDEAFKKAYTDALMNAFKFIGVGADVHMGRFDDNKYVQQMYEEFAPQEEKPQQGKQKPPPLTGPIKTRAEIRVACGEFVRELNACGDGDQLEAFIAESKPLLDQVREEVEFYWIGDGADFAGLEKEIENARDRVYQGNPV